MSYNPAYTLQSGAKPVRTDPFPRTIEGKLIPGYLTTFSDGTSKWTSREVVNNTGAIFTINNDYSTFTGKKDDDGNWIWEATTPSSIPNLSKETGISEQNIENALNSRPFQNELNGGRVNQLGGIDEARKIDPTIPLTGGTISDPNADPNTTSSASGPTTAKDLRKNDLFKPPDQVVPKGTFISYPLDLAKSTMDRISFRSLEINKEEYSTRFNPGTSSPDGTLGPFLDEFISPQNTYRPKSGKVFIGIQAPISDQNSVGWGNGNLNALDAYLYKKALGLFETQDIPGALQQAAQEIYGITKQSNEEILRLIAGMAANMNDILPRVSAKILNPNLELLFQGPQLRPFNFTFNLIAYDAEESKEIKKIIKFFKQNMAVRRDENYLFLKAPYVFEIKYINGDSGNDHQSINLITGDSEKTTKACALTNCSVDYTPLGSYMTFQDKEKSMVQYTLNLQFQELTPVYDSDYKGLPEDSIGY